MQFNHPALRSLLEEPSSYYISFISRQPVNARYASHTLLGDREHVISHQRVNLPRIRFRRSAASSSGTPSLPSVQEHLSTLSCPYHPAKKESKCLLGRGGMRGGLTGVSVLVASHVRKEQALVIYTAGDTEHKTQNKVWTIKS